MSISFAMTPRDKKLLMLVSSALILVVSYQSLIMPTVQDKQDLEAQEAELSNQQMEWQLQISRLNALNKDIADAEEERLKVTAPYYAPMENQEVDRLLTNLALKQSLMPKSIEITAAEPGKIESYLYEPETVAPEQDLSAEEMLMGDEEESQPEAEPSLPTVMPVAVRDMVTIGKATMTVQGSRENWMKMVDDILKNYPSLQIVRFSTEEQTYLDDQIPAAGAHEITCEINILMCEKQGEAE